MPESTVVRVKRDVQIVLYNSGATLSYTVSLEAGDFNFAVPDTTVVNPLDRGELGATPQLRKGDDQPMTGGFSAYFRDAGDTANAYATLNGIAWRLSGRYEDTNWTSTHGSNGDVPTVTLSASYDGTPFGEADKTLTFPFVVLRANYADGDPCSLNVTFTSYALKPTLS